MPEKTTPPNQLSPLDLSGESKYVPPESSIGERIKEARRGLEISVEQLSDLTSRFDHEAGYADGSGISVPSLYRYERGERLPGARELRILCEALKVSANWLLRGLEESDPEVEYRKIGESFCALIDRAKGLNRDGGSPSNDLLHALKLSETKSKPR